jgi:hypothetical protein
MSTQFNKFVVTQALGTAGLNAGINAIYTWGLWRSLDPLTLFGENAIAFDLASTPVWIAALSTLLGTASIRQKLRDCRVAVPRTRAPAIFDKLPDAITLRAAVLGGVGAVVFGLSLRLLLHASGVDRLSLAAALVMKVAITVPLSLVIVPLIIFAALADVQKTSRAREHA